MASGSVLHGASQDGKQTRHVDYIMPLFQGGTNWPDNLQLLCPRCNRAKGSLLPETWAKRLAGAAKANVVQPPAAAP